MKPNDKAIEAALPAAKTVLRNNEITIDSAIFAAVTAAYAAQFKSEEYAGLLKDLRTPHGRCLDMRHDAADAIEALLAERDALNFELAARKEWPQARAEMLEELAKVRAERDALAARFAPVEDEALVEIALQKFKRVYNDTHVTREAQQRTSISAVIAAIRPHIEAVERERCAKIAEDRYYLMKNKQYISPEWMNGYISSTRDIAAAIRSGK